MRRADLNEAAIALGAVALLLAGCSRPPAPAASPAPPVELWARVEAAADATTLDAPARVLPDPASTTVITPPLRATLVRIHARAGDAVEAGAPLVEVVMPELLEAAGRLEGARVRLEAWTSRHAQLIALRADGLARSLEVSEAFARVAEAKADLQAARAVLLGAGIREGDAATGLQRGGVLTLRAPVAGVVTRVSAVVGERREPSAGALVELASPGAVRIEARFNQPPAPGSFEFEANDARVPLRLLNSSPAADPKDGTFLVWFEPIGVVPLSAGRLGRVLRLGAQGGGAMRVPALALYRVAGVAQVETRRGAVTVEVLRCEAKTCLVQGALEVADEVRITAPKEKGET